MTVREAIYLAALVIVTSAFVWAAHHERMEGEQREQHSVQQATAKAEQAAAVQSAALLTRANEAEQRAQTAQIALDTAVASGPAQPIRLCHTAPDSRPGLSTARATVTTATSTGTGPDVGASMPTGGNGSGPDIRPALELIVRGFGELAITDKEWQSR